ncbi:MAG: carboxymuconolactone decarboxylase family protein [Phocaeicola dorei]|nr:carboxymuconolactone decarboxylase family protein [Phocaeicola dorei]
MKHLLITLFATVAILFGGHPLNAQDMKKEIPQISVFPVGDKLPEMFSKYFIGQAYLATLTQNKDLNCPVMNVTFEPGCRNNWHSHTGGQLLIAVGGKGYYQERGKVARMLLPGDVVEIPANIEHWHGAAPDSWFSHLAIETNPQDNKNTWLEAVDDEQYIKATSDSSTTAFVPRLSEEAVKNHEAWFPGYVSKVKDTDPELIEVFDNFAFDEVLNHGNLNTKTRIMVTLASAIAQHTVNEYKMMLNAAISNGVTPVEIKEILYQSVAYVGVARVIDFIGVTNEFLTSHGVKLPLEPQTTASPETRYEKGLALQKEIFGQMIDDMEKAAPANQKHIQRYLSANCFGDYQTRTGLDKRMRELITFSILVSLGGCESQVKGHIRGNVAVGNDKEYLLEVVTQLLPYIGYPRTLNAIACLNEVIPEKK